MLLEAFLECFPMFTSISLSISEFVLRPFIYFKFAIVKMQDLGQGSFTSGPPVFPALFFTKVSLGGSSYVCLPSGLLLCWCTCPFVFVKMAHGIT